jgi:hypothetical protein
MHAALTATTPDAAQRAEADVIAHYADPEPPAPAAERLAILHRLLRDNISQ